MPKNLRQCKSGKDFEGFALKNGFVVRKGAGSHVKVYNKEGNHITVPLHGNKQLGRGIRAKILKWFLLSAAFLLLVAVGFLVV